MNRNLSGHQFWWQGLEDEHGQPRDFFHGTDRDIEGDLVVPHSQAAAIHERQGAEAWSGPDRYPELYEAQPWRAHHVFSTGDENEAWSWNNTGMGRSRVLQVQPVGEPSEEAQSAHSSSDVNDEMVSRQAIVQNTIWTPAPHHDAAGRETKNWREVAGGVQGTLPPVDWDRY